MITEAPKVKVPAVEKGTSRAKIRIAGRITVEEIERLLLFSPSRDRRLFVEIVWHAGLRRNEALAIEGDDVDLAGHLIALPQNKASDRAATAIITPELDRILRERFGDRMPHGRLLATLPTDCRAISRAFRKIATKATVRGNGKNGQCVLHDLRRNFGSRWAAKVPAQVCKG